MFFLISKILWFLVEPSHLLAFAAIAAAILLHTRYVAVGRQLAVATAIAFFVIGFFPLWIWLLRPIEDRYARPTAPPAHVDGVLVLGDGAEPQILHSRGTLTPELSDPRFVTAFELARRYPNARIVFTGGSGEVGGAAFSEVQSAQYLFRQLGLNPSRVVYEGRSRNTWENIAFSYKMANPRPGETWLLAISAYQVPRAMLAARHMHWKLVPWPTDYLTARSGVRGFFYVADNLKYFDLAVHEWIGLLAYSVK